MMAAHGLAAGQTEMSDLQPAFSFFESRRPTPMQSLEKIIQALQLFQKGKEMYVHPLDVTAVENYLTGFRGACSACGVEIPRKLRQQVIETRGWKHSASGPAPQMKAKGLSDPAIMDALIEIEIEQFRRLAQQSS